eukprot:351341-Chlamydomonas_euryale.AAC.1
MGPCCVKYESGTAATPAGQHSYLSCASMYMYVWGSGLAMRGRSSGACSNRRCKCGGQDRKAPCPHHTAGTGLVELDDLAVERVQVERGAWVANRDADSRKVGFLGRPIEWCELHHPDAAHGKGGKARVRVREAADGKAFSRVRAAITRLVSVLSQMRRLPPPHSTHPLFIVWYVHERGRGSGSIRRCCVPDLTAGRHAWSVDARAEQEASGVRSGVGC